jgi:hypothetical protein
MRRCPARSSPDRKRDRKHGPRPIRAIRRRNDALHSFHEATGDRETQSGTRSHLIGLPRPIELVKDVFEVAGRNAFTFI